MIVSIGIDVSKDKLDINSAEKHQCIENKKEMIVKAFGGIPKETRIVMEATGKYHRLAHHTLTAMGFSVMVINPYQSKHFAKAMKLLCKTDKVDARILRLFGEKMDFVPTLVQSEIQLSLQDISRHLEDLLKIRKQLEARRRESEGFIGASLDTAIEAIDKQIEAAEKELKAVVKEDKAVDEQVKLLVSIPGVGEATAITLISYLKELGKVSREAIAALAGLAPMNHDSGMHQGKRRIQGGRGDIRAKLYMPIVGAATRHNRRLKGIYERHMASGKAAKVALTACMRKLLVWANAILSTGEPWQEGHGLRNTCSS